MKKMMMDPISQVDVPYSEVRFVDSEDTAFLRET